MRTPAVRNWTHRLIGKRIIAAQRGQEKKRIDPIRKKLFQRREKRWRKLLTYSSDETKSFALGFSLGLIANETILMPPELILAYPLTEPFKYICHKWPWMDEKLYRVSEWGLESIRSELNRRKGSQAT